MGSEIIMPAFNRNHMPTTDIYFTPNLTTTKEHKILLDTSTTEAEVVNLISILRYGHRSIFLFRTYKFFL
jgi:hypothetical protein